MKTIYTFTLDSDDYLCDQFKFDLRLIAHLMYEFLYSYDGDGFIPLNINKNIIYNNIHFVSCRREYYFDSDKYDDGYINYEPFLIGNRSFGLTVNDDSINEEILQDLIRQVLFITKINYTVTIGKTSYFSKNKEDESNRRKAICQVYNDLNCEVPYRKFNLNIIYEIYDKLVNNLSFDGSFYIDSIKNRLSDSYNKKLVRTINRKVYGK